MEVDTIQKPALAVDPPDENFDPDLIPETGEQYLQKVMYERGKCPVVVVAAKPHNRHNPQKVLTGLGALPTDDVKNVAPQALMPTKEWESMQNQKFAELRDIITSYRGSAQYSENLQRTHVFLNFDDRKQLHEYCANNLPYVRILLSIPQRNLEMLLEYLHEWLQDTEPTSGQSSQDEPSDPELCDATSTMTPTGSKEPLRTGCRKDWITQWIYAILACLILPLEPYIHSVLRDIAKSCITLRNELKQEDEAKVLPLNLLISIISKNFKQADLADNVP
ncbi:AGAP005413-PA-like protein [Anopheles sinensis]|uniref:Gem-associated protein 2 n=1 Tax=Anopheles sinensis TaxID=74873 RepID=A0A084WDA7_ANOSI|nr:AGAP005413-PA-like protein [Anopheles sinensis]